MHDPVTLTTRLARRRLLLSFAAVALTACGGGGDTPAPQPPSPAPPGLPPPPGLDWAGPETLGASNNEFQLAVNATGAAVAVWAAGADVGGPDGERIRVWASRFTPARGWSTAEAVYDNRRGGVDVGNIGAPQVALDAQGNAVLAWRNDSPGSRDDPHSIWTLRGTVADDGKPVWSSAGRVPSPGVAEPDGVATLAMLPDGRALLAWVDTLPADGEVGAQRNLWVAEGDGLAWTTTLLEHDDGDVGAPHLATGAGGHAGIVWQQVDDGGVTRVRFSRRNAAESWSEAVVLSPGVGTAGQAANNPCLAWGRTGQAIALWRQAPREAGAYELWASQGSSAGAWSDGERIDTAKSDSPLDAVLAMDEAGNATAVWQQGDGSGFNRVWSQHLRASTGRWAARDVQVNTEAISQAGSPQVAMDGQGRAIAVWAESVGGVAQINARRHDPASGWLDAPARIDSPAVGDVFSNAPQIGVDGSGRALAAWTQTQGMTLKLWVNRSL